MKSDIIKCDITIIIIIIIIIIRDFIKDANFKESLIEEGSECWREGPWWNTKVGTGNMSVTK